MAGYNTHNNTHSLSKPSSSSSHHHSASAAPPPRPSPSSSHRASSLPLRRPPKIHESDSSDSDSDANDTDASRAPPSKSTKSGTDSGVEELCPLCGGTCHCGGAEGKKVYRPAGSLKLRLSVPTPQHHPSAPVVAPAPAPIAGPAPPLVPVAAPLPAPAPAPRKRGRPRKDRSGDQAFVPKKKEAKKERAGSTSGSGSGASRTSTPQRMSLRQVLAASLADAAPPEPERREEVRVVHVDRERERLSEVSDLDLDLGDDDESDDEGMMKHEERAMREEFEKRGESSMSSSESSDSSEDEAAGRKKPRVGSFGEPVDWGTVQDEMVDPEAEKEQMFGGGRGVVTWSDYDDDDEEEGNGDETEDDAELDGLLLQHANSKRDRQAEEAELEALWLEEEQENEGDDESSDGEETEDDDEEQTLVFMDGWEAFARGGGAVINGSESEMDDDETDFSEEEIDAGDTTDSLDSDDHVNLVRFGIEDDEEDSDSEDDDDFGRGMVSLADVQAPTTADLASLPQHFLFSSKRGVSVMVRVEEDGVEEDEVALREAMFRKAKKGKGRAYELAEIVEESDRDTEREGKARGNPAMGMFDRKFRGKKELCVVIDESDAVAPSPFSKMKRKKRRHMLTGSPPRRTRSDSKVSTTTATSVTDGSISGEILDVASPFLPQLEPEGWDFALNDVLDASLLNNGSSASDSSESDVETTIRLAGSTSSSARKPSTPGISDLSRWSRIPIGAFRSSTVSSSFSPSAHYFAAVEDDPTSRSSPGNSIFLPLSNKSILRSAQGASSLSHTLSSPRGMSTTQRAIERMLTSPVFGPISSPVPQFSVDGPKSRKDRRKEKKAKSSTSIAMTSPKKEVVASTSK